ncbi:universal stress protein [Maribacter sp. ACAM166]|uniref:universal stress protein n=1 Tax=Maribacter sp. ACAM166 TaxID=2508996 RepID=UPI0010FD90B9|nr:universal stress protein [Maribacter sp. ACAM166]TLP71136.1 universal stress protein [Maribacter sp. ACAM166]
MEIKNILVATDFSNEAYNALFYATQILASKPCTFHIIHIYDDFTSSTNTKNIFFLGKEELTRLRITSQENLTETVHKIVLDTSNKLHTYNTISSKGTIASAISHTLDNLEIDLIVMGNKGKTGAKELFMGSNTLKVANSIMQCPILAIPREIAYTPLDEIAFVTDFKKGCTRKTLVMLLTLASISNAAIRILHINDGEIMTTKQEANKKLLKICLASKPHRFDAILNYADKANVIQDYLTENKIKMFSMSYHRRNFFERLIYEPVIMDLSIYAKIPFLILPIQD